MAAKLDLSNQFAKKYKTILSGELRNGPNFSGKYRISQIGCGASCVEVAIIDCETGRVFDPKIYVDGAHKWVKSGMLEFKDDSALLIVSGCLNEKSNKCGFHYFQWTGSDLKLIQFKALKP